MIYHNKELFENSSKYCFLLGDKERPYDNLGQCIILDINDIIDLQKEYGGDILIFKRIYLTDYMSNKELFNRICYADDTDTGEYVKDYMTRNKPRFLKVLDMVSSCFGDELISGEFLGVFKDDAKEI